MAFLKKLLGFLGVDSDGNPAESQQPRSTPSPTPIVTNPSCSENLVSKPAIFDTHVVGVSFHQDAIAKICDNRREEGIALFKQARVVPYDDNPHDAYAVRVEIEDQVIGHLSRTGARLWRSRMISDNQSGIVSCTARIIWDKKFDKEGSYGVLLDIDLSLPDSKIEPGSASRMWQSHSQPDQVEFLVNQLNRFELSHCKVGDPVGLWDVPGTREIFIYRQGTDFGEGKLGICPEEACEIIRKAPGCDASIASIYEGACKIDCRIISKAEMAERLKPFRAKERKRRQDLKRDLITPIACSPISSDIYKCFISNQSGMCDAIGTWEQFRIIEKRIAKLCQKNSGKYYKTKAKAAKFAIIFAPNAKVCSNVTSLKKMGYEVTTFEKALEYFGLSDLWDCKKMAQHEYETKKFIFEDTFHKPFPLSREAE